MLVVVCRDGNEMGWATSWGGKNSCVRPSDLVEPDLSPFLQDSTGTRARGRERRAALEVGSGAEDKGRGRDRIGTLGG